jgi:hypothetical protein
LRAIDEALDPTIARSLNKPARTADVNAIAKAVFAGTLPADLRAWFAWHDGQGRIASLDPDNNFTAMAAKPALATWRFLHDPDEDCLHPTPTWFPLFENGGGDHLMYETAGKHRGALFTYWHDDEAWPRKPKYRSLVDWATRVAKAHARRARAPKRTPVLDPAVMRFTRLGRAPTRAVLTKLEIGTVFRAVYHDEWLVVYLKVTPELWLWAGGETFDEAIDELDLELSRVKRSEFTCDANEVHDELEALDPRQRRTLSRALVRITR